MCPAPITEPEGSVDRDDLSLEMRHRAALRLIHSGSEADGELLLSLVVWPTLELDRTTAAALGHSS